MGLPTRSATLPVSFRSLTVLDSVRAAAARGPGNTAIVHGERSLSFGDLVARADKLRDAMLTGFGLGRGDRVAIVARNCVEYMEIVCGVPDAGVAVATVNPRLAPAEIGATIADAGARVVFTDAATAETVRAAGLDPSVAIVVFGDDYEALIAGAAPADVYPTIDEWDVWTIPYTSGTTGQPKGVMLSHRSRLLFSLISASEFGCFGPDDKFLAMTPMAFGGGLGFPLASLSTGGSIEILDKFDAELTLAKLKFGGFTGIFMVPTHFQMIFELPPETLERYRLPPIKAIVSNAAPLPQALKQKIVPYFGEGRLHEIYSSTEMGVVCNLRPRFQLLKERCVGTPQAHAQVSIRDLDGAECGPDKVGELFVRSPTLFNGYLNRPEETAKAFKNGWVSVGDMARRDGDGFLYIVDRKKDMVISGGVNIYPREIEELLLHHPAVAEVAVIGVPDERWGERLRAVVVARKGETLTAADVADYCAGKLAAYKIPRELSLVEALPRNANGKVLKTDLRKLA